MDKKNILILWMSRHPLDKIALDAMKLDIKESLQENNKADLGDVFIEELNVTWGTTREEIGKKVSEIGKEFAEKYKNKADYTHVAGVFPAQVMHFFVKNNIQFATAISEPAAAKHGEDRKFKFKEWLYW